MNIHDIWERLDFVLSNRRVNWVKTILFNFRTLPFKTACKLPVYIYGKVQFRTLAGKVDFQDCEPKRGMIKIGRHGDYFSIPNKSYIWLGKNAKIIFRGPCYMGYNLLLRVESGILDIGEFTGFGTNYRIICFNHIKIGRHVRMTFDGKVVDSNCHYVINTVTNQIRKNTTKIEIEDFCWIGNNTTIMKGVILPKYSIVASGSLLNKNYKKEVVENAPLFLAGSPAKVKGYGFKMVLSLTRENEIKNYFQRNPENDYMIWQGKFEDPVEDLSVIFK